MHGHLGLLLKELRRVGYDGAAGDVLVCCGDWLDRGEDVLAIRDLIKRDPSILWVKGNHESMLEASVREANPRQRAAARAFHLRHGGEWIHDHLVDVDGTDEPTAELLAFCDLLNDAPLAYRILTPGRHDVGIVHADVPAETWGDMARALGGREPERSRIAQLCLWSRERADRILAGTFDHSVPDLDHVFLGHTIAGRTPVTRGNVTLLDTGAYHYGILTVVDVDEWIAAPARRAAAGVA